MSHDSQTTVDVPENIVYLALTAIAAVIEEPHCIFGSDEARLLVKSHAALQRAVGFDPEYVLRENRIEVSGKPGRVIKSFLPVSTGVAAAEESSGVEHG